MLTLDLKITYADEKTASAVLHAVCPENEGYVTSTQEGNILIFKINGKDAGSVRNTADDLLACIKAAEEASGLVSGSASDLDGDSLLE